MDMSTELIAVKNKIKKARDILRKAYYQAMFKCGEKYQCNDALDLRVLDNIWKDKNVSCISESGLSHKDNEIMVSLVIPFYNAEKYIYTCLNSLVDQKTNFKYEIIAVNDGSKDTTKDILNDYCEKYKFISVISQENKGISEARNTGILRAKGKYIGFVDQDDWVNDNYVEELVSIAEREKADIVKCGFDLWDNGFFLKRESLDNKIILESKNELLLKMPSYIWSGIYSRELLQYIRFPSGYWYEDMIARLLIFRCSKKIVCDSNCLYNKLYHKNNASSVVWSTKKAKCLEQFYLPKSLIADNEKLGIKRDVYLYESVLIEYTRIMVHRVSGMPSKVQKQIFLGCREVLHALYDSEYYDLMTDEMKNWHNIIFDRNFIQWKAKAYI